MSEPSMDSADVAKTESVEPVPLPLLTLRDGLPRVTSDEAGLARAVAALHSGSGPVAIDTERASGYRYSQRAYLIQIRRAGSGTILIDPIALPHLEDLARALAEPEWVLHAASQDLPCLAELGLQPRTLFDTELAGRLLDLPRVGLAPMVESILGRGLRKSHGAADWSRRPLPDTWLEYAALDVEVLLELREVLLERLREQGKLEWATQEFEAVRLVSPPSARVDPWRRTSGLHKVRTRRGLAIVAELWRARDRLAAETDQAPGRLLPDASLIAAGLALPRDGQALRALPDFHGRGARRHAQHWGLALVTAWQLEDEALPQRRPPSDDSPPLPRIWAQRNPDAAARLERGRAALAGLAAELNVPLENLLAPAIVRRLHWDPPIKALYGDVASIAEFLEKAGARRWQVEQTAAAVAAAMASSGDVPDAAG